MLCDGLADFVLIKPVFWQSDMYIWQSILACYQDRAGDMVPVPGTHSKVQKEDESDGNQWRTDRWMDGWKE